MDFKTRHYPVYIPRLREIWTKEQAKLSKSTCGNSVKRESPSLYEGEAG